VYVCMCKWTLTLLSKFADTYVRTQTQFDGFVSFVGSQFGELRG
jgi:hypothetical protein